MTELNSILLEYFGLEIPLDGSNQRYQQASPISVDEMLNAASCVQSTYRSVWKWRGEISVDDRFKISSQFNKLAVERAELDCYIFIEAKVSSRTYRHRAISRLKTILSGLLPAHRLAANTRH